MFVLIFSFFEISAQKVKPNESICEENIPIVGVKKGLSDE